MCVYARKSFSPNPAGLEVYSIFSDILFCWCRGTAGGLGGGGGGGGELVVLKCPWPVTVMLTVQKK